MRLSWLRAGRPAEPPSSVLAEEMAAVEQSAPGMRRVMERLFEGAGQPEILDLGQPGGSPAVYLADRGARVSVEAFEPPRTSPEASSALVLAQQEGRFDLVLGWDHWDFVAPDRLAELSAEVQRVLAPGGWLVLFSRDGTVGVELVEDRPARYRMVADDHVLRLTGSGPVRPRWNHPTRKIEIALAPLAIQGVHLQRDRVREFVARKLGG